MGALIKIWIHGFPGTVRVFSAGLIAGWMAVAGRAADELVAEGPLVSLPPLMVEDQAAPLPWRYVALPGMEVLSVCDDAVTIEFLRRTHRLGQLLPLLVPSTFLAEFDVPEIQILFNEKLGHARSREVMEEMVREQGGSLTRGGSGVFQLGIPGLGRPRMEFLPNLRLTDIDAMAVFAALEERSSRPMGFGYDPDRIEFLLERRTPALPGWFIEGVMGVVRRATFEETEIEVRSAEWLSPEETRAIEADADRPRALWPMQEMFMGRRWRPGDELDERAKVWRAQCELFVRWAMMANNGERKEALGRFVERLETEALSERMFVESFGIGFSDMRDRLSDYLPVAVRRDAVLKATKLTDLPRLRFRAPTAVEIARIRGEWERMEIGYVKNRFPEVTARYIDQARRTLRAPYDRGARDGALLAAIGLMECDADNPAGAEEFLEAAVRAGVERPRVYLELAKIRHGRLAGGADAPKLTRAQVEQVLAPLAALPLMKPPLFHDLVLIAQVWSECEEPPSAADLRRLNEGLSRFPQVSALVLRAVYLNTIAGAVESAVALTELGLRHTREPETRERFERVRQELLAHVN